MFNAFKEALVGEYGQQACPDMHMATVSCVEAYLFVSTVGSNTTRA